MNSGDIQNFDHNFLPLKRKRMQPMTALSRHGVGASGSRKALGSHEANGKFGKLKEWSSPSRLKAKILEDFR